MKKTLIPFLCLIGLCCTSYAFAGHYDIVDKVHQPENKSRKVEKADIFAIQCSSQPGKVYYIYQYYRKADRPNFRAILPPNWGSPLGGKDHTSFEEAICAACGCEDTDNPAVTPNKSVAPDTPPISSLPPAAKKGSSSVVLD